MICDGVVPRAVDSQPVRPDDLRHRQPQLELGDTRAEAHPRAVAEAIAHEWVVEERPGALPMDGGGVDPPLRPELGGGRDMRRVCREANGGEGEPRSRGQPRRAPRRELYLQRVRQPSQKGEGGRGEPLHLTQDRAQVGHPLHAFPTRIGVSPQHAAELRVQSLLRRWLQGQVQQGPVQRGSDSLEARHHQPGHVGRDLRGSQLPAPQQGVYVRGRRVRDAGGDVLVRPQQHKVETRHPTAPRRRVQAGVPVLQRAHQHAARALHGPHRRGQQRLVALQRAHPPPKQRRADHLKAQPLQKVLQPAAGTSAAAAELPSCVSRDGIQRRVLGGVAWSKEALLHASPHPHPIARAKRHRLSARQRRDAETKVLVKGPESIGCTPRTRATRTVDVHVHFGVKDDDGLLCGSAQSDNAAVVCVQPLEHLDHARRPAVAQQVPRAADDGKGGGAGDLHAHRSRGESDDSVRKTAFGKTASHECPRPARRGVGGRRRRSDAR
mmetsp:Transcript_3804/g.11215  ORF Transcript_3804/g.11215 Transcript_3804/m.11215 type:complete len:495 (-) Transcript_3804:24-1508(-)